EQVNTMERHSKSSIRISNIQNELQAIRRAILRYTFDQDEISLAESEKALAKATDLLAEAEKAALSGEERAIYLDIAKSVAELKAKRSELIEIVSQMLAGRKLLFVDGDQLTADLQKLVNAVQGTSVEPIASILEDKVFLMRIANWRTLATHDVKGSDNFKTQVGRAQEQIAAIEKSELSGSLAPLLTAVKTGVAKYQAAFDKTAPNLLRANDLYTKTMAPITIDALGKMDRLKTSASDRFDTTVAETNRRIETVTATQKTAASATVLIGFLIAFLIARGIVRPLSALTAAMKELAAGNFGIVLPGLDRKDEVGDMAHAVEGFKVRAEEKAREEAEAKTKQDAAIAHQRKAEMQKLADGFEAAVGQIVETVSKASNELEDSAKSLTTNAERAEQKTVMVASASEQATANVQSVASATEELFSSVNEIGRQVQDSARMASEAVGQARSTTDRVSDLSKAASRIGDVVELISTIAGQTNLLALNATIEAARAGEAGRGFAVVASEVKALAEQTAKATGEIGQQISGIQTATQDSVNAIKEISGTIEKLAEISATIAAAVEEQGAATQEISRNVQQAAKGTQDVSSNIVDVQRGASETGSASSQVLSAAQSLSSDSSRLREEVGRFLHTVRAA
ncbi:MAG TPA: methyl-accepting chemotaxis protein, partial [Bradyrhizobium sp.]|nr:methyl-accepting chemotaxis protein [Bradyrhizobium sp.]